MALSVKEKELTTPFGISLKSDLATGLAWDNYDENNETLSGSGTLHDTTGICYQKVEFSPSSHNNTTINTDRNAGKRKRKRSFDYQPDDLEPYRKKPKISHFEFVLTNVLSPDLLDSSKKADVVWYIASFLHDSMPQWVGWNSLVVNDKSPLQNICYMENLSLPPTQLDVVLEVLKRSENVRLECGQPYMPVTFDHAIAKPAAQIQSEESPKFDKLFIQYGGLHILFVFFSCLGYLLADGGIPDILADTGVIAQGSLKGFLNGKHYNRCKRVHVMLVRTLRTLHIQKFLEYNDDSITASIKKMINEILKQKCNTVLVHTELISSTEFDAFYQMYDGFCSDTRNGRYGKTSQMYMFYLDCMESYFLFTRAYKLNDVDLLIYSLEQMVPLFFDCGKVNYARWMTWYILKLLNIDNTHPGLKMVLQDGNLGIKRTNKPFSGTPIDQTLEQTANKDAASRLTGISCFTQNIGARKRWNINKSMRTSVVKELNELVGISSTLDVYQELRPNQIKKDNRDCSKLITCMRERINPFSSSIEDDQLYSISTGRAASPIVAESLTTFIEVGKSRYNTFKQECLKDSSRFDRPLSCPKIKNFSSDLVKSKSTSKDLNVAQVHVSRDLFGRLLCLAEEKGIDLKYCLKWPLLPFPASLAYADGTMKKTSKSKLMQLLEKRGQTCSDIEIDVYLIDCMFLLHLLKVIPGTYGGLSQQILKMVLNYGVEVHLVADIYKEPSIKDSEHLARGYVDTRIVVEGADQICPKNFDVSLRSPSFKTSLIDFLVKDWMSDKHASTIAGKTLFVTCRDLCYKYTESRGTVNQCLEPALTCSHVEADTRLFFHANYVNSQSNQGRR
jgi:hypothetical protein